MSIPPRNTQPLPKQKVFDIRVAKKEIIPKNLVSNRNNIVPTSKQYWMAVLVPPESLRHYVKVDMK